MQKILRYFNFTPKVFMQVIFITINAQLIYAFWDVRNTVPGGFPEFLGVTDANAGSLYSMQGLVIILGTIALGWIGDRFTLRTIMLIATLGVAGISAFMTIFSPHLGMPILLVCFFVMLGFSEVLFKPANFKALRISADEKHQGSVFGFFEFGRGLIAFLISLLWTILIACHASTRIILITASTIIFATAILLFIAVPKDERVHDGNVSNTSTIEAIKGIGKVSKLPVVWLAGINVFCIYGTFVAAGTYFARYLQAGYGTSALLAALFATVVIALRMLPLLSAALVTKVFPSVVSFMRFMEILLVVLLAAIGLLLLLNPATVHSFPHGSVPPHIVSSGVFWLLAILMLVASGVCFMIRGVYYAPIGEFGVPEKYSSSAMSFAITIGYIPALIGPIIFAGVIKANIKNSAGKIVTDVLTPTSYLGIVFFCLSAVTLIAVFMSHIMVGQLAKGNENKNLLNNSEK